MQQQNKGPYVIVLGNEKGGTGKSTLSMHIIASLLHDGFKVGSIDVDARQGTLSRYLENRKNTNEALSKPLLIPNHIPVFKSEAKDQTEAENQDMQNLDDAFKKLSDMDFIVVDTPGNDTALSRFAHIKADTLITPMNDSFIDLDVLVRLKGDSMDMLKPSHYAETVWNQKKLRASQTGKMMDWIVIRNRLSSINAKNKEQMDQVMRGLSKRLGFKYISGFGERVVFKELFLSGLTLLDMDVLKQSDFSLSHVAARQELRSLISAIDIPALRDKKESAEATDEAA